MHVPQNSQYSNVAVRSTNTAERQAQQHTCVDCAVWLPNARVAQAWSEFVQTGGTNDTTPPPAPTHVQATRTADGVALTWDTAIDLESGLMQIIIQCDGHEIGRLPEKPAGRFGRPLFQSMSSWDTPNERPLRWLSSTKRLVPIPRATIILLR